VATARSIIEGQPAEPVWPEMNLGRYTRNLYDANGFAGARSGVSDKVPSTGLSGSVRPGSSLSSGSLGSEGERGLNYVQGWFLALWFQPITS